VDELNLDTRLQTSPPATDKFWDRLREIVEKGLRELSRLARVGKMKWDAILFQKQRRNLYFELGVKIHHLYQEGTLDPAKVRELIERIESLTTQIEKQHSLISEMVRKKLDSTEHKETVNQP